MESIALLKTALLNPPDGYRVHSKFDRIQSLPSWYIVENAKHKLELLAQFLLALHELELEGGRANVLQKGAIELVAPLGYVWRRYEAREYATLLNNDVETLADCLDVMTEGYIGLEIVESAREYKACENV